MRQRSGPLRKQVDSMRKTEFKRFDYHFEPGTGWMNDPNGLVFFRGRYHAFFQHNPHSPRWDRMHWGHAVSDDLIHWEELPIALFPDQPYEDEGGCFSGSAVEKDGRLYLFYTSVSRELGQTQSVAWSDDGIHFTKYPGNPVIRKNPLGSPDFRDPKVVFLDGKWHMVVGSGDPSCGKVLLFTSEDLLSWAYSGVLFEGAEYAHCIECPDFFKLGDSYVLMFSKIGETEGSTYFVAGDFREGKLVNTGILRPEWGPDFYAPQTFWDGKRRIVIGWMYHWGKEAPQGCGFAGALSIPRELKFAEGKLVNFPVEEAWGLLKTESPYVRREAEQLVLGDRNGNTVTRQIPAGSDIRILEDTKSLEIFVNGGMQSFSYWLE